MDVSLADPSSEGGDDDNLSIPHFYDRDSPASWHMTPIRFSSGSDSEPGSVSVHGWSDVNDAALETNEVNEEPASPLDWTSDEECSGLEDYLQNDSVAALEQEQDQDSLLSLRDEPDLQCILANLLKQRADFHTVDVQPRTIPLTCTRSVWAFRLCQESIADTRDLFVDNFAPWACAGGCQQLQRFYDYNSSDRIVTLRSKKELGKTTANVVLAVISNKLSRNTNLQRKVYMLVSPRVYAAVVGSNYVTSLNSDVVVVYSWNGGEIPVPLAHGNCKTKQPFVRLKPSVGAEAEEMLQTVPPTTVTRKLALRHDSFIKRHQTVYRKRQCTEPIVEKCGRTQKDDFSPLACLSREFGWNLWTQERPKRKKVGDELVAVTDRFCIVLSRAACSMFASQAPTANELQSMKKEVDRILTQSEEEILRFCTSRYVSDGANRGLLKTEFGRGVLFLDFTFKAASKQMGVISFLSNSFVRTNGGKAPLIDLGYVFVEKPDSEVMFFVGSHLASYFSATFPKVRVSGLVTDRELALKSLISEHFDLFRETVHLHCSLHMKENLKANLGSSKGEELHQELFGTKKGY